MSFVGKWFGFGKDPSFDDGIRAYEKRAFSDAMEKFRDAIKESKDRALRDRARSYLAGSLGKMANEAILAREFDDALAYLSEAVEVRDDFADLWLQKGRVQFILGDLQSAEISVSRALDLNPNYSLARFLFNLIKYRREEHSAGVAGMKEAVERDSRLDTAEWKEGLAKHAAGDFDAALKNFKEVRPAFSDVHDYVSQGDAAAKKGHWEEAKSLFAKASDIAPAYADIAVRLGQVNMELNELDDALEQFVHAQDLNPTYAEAVALKGVVLRRLGRDEEAVSAFRETLQIDPGHPIASQEVLYRR